MNRLRIAAAAVVAATAALLASGVLKPSAPGVVDAVPGYELDAGAECIYRSGLATAEVVGQWLPGWDGGASYAVVRVCANPAQNEDGGVQPLPPGYDLLPDYEERGPEAYDGGPQLRVWLQGDVAAPYLCACAKDATCLRNDGSPAAQGVTLGHGQWQGAGCLPKSCVEFAGVSSWPKECPQ
jgi:hypothetical protein